MRASRASEVRRHLHMASWRTHERRVVESTVLYRNMRLVNEELGSIPVPWDRRYVEALPNLLLPEHSHLIILHIISTRQLSKLQIHLFSLPLLFLFMQ